MAIRGVLNGCFDVFHEGHRDILHYALRICCHGSLLVLVNSDESTKRLKGSDRPIEPVQTRIKNIESCQNQWCLEKREYPTVFIQTFNTEVELKDSIDSFRPDLIIKGNDRTDVKDIVGSEDWPVVIVPRSKDKKGKDISTTRTKEEQEKYFINLMTDPNI